MNHNIYFIFFLEGEMFEEYIHIFWHRTPVNLMLIAIYLYYVIHYFAIYLEGEVALNFDINIILSSN